MKNITLFVTAVLSTFLLLGCGDPKSITGEVVAVSKAKGGFLHTIYGVPRSGYMNTVDIDGTGTIAILHSNDKLFNKGDIIEARVEKKIFSGTYMHPTFHEKTEMNGYSFDKFTFIHNEPENIISELKNKIIKLKKDCHAI